VLRVYRIPYSTNVERVALAAGHKCLAVEWVDVDPADRADVVRLSGQELVPVLDDDGTIVADSTAIIEHLERRFPERPLYPADPARRAELEVFIDWFNRVWKRPPNELAEELDRPRPDADRVAALGAELAGGLDTFEALLSGRDHLLGAELSAADCAAHPFLRYARDRPAPGDDETFHRVLHEHQPLGDAHPRLAAWIERVAAAPRA